VAVASTTSARPPPSPAPSAGSPREMQVFAVGLLRGRKPKAGRLGLTEHCPITSPPRTRRSRERYYLPSRFGLAQPPSGFTSSVTSFVSDQVRNDVFIKVLS